MEWVNDIHPSECACRCRSHEPWISMMHVFTMCQRVTSLKCTWASFMGSYHVLEDDMTGPSPVRVWTSGWRMVEGHSMISPSEWNHRISRKLLLLIYLYYGMYKKMVNFPSKIILPLRIKTLIGIKIAP